MKTTTLVTFMLQHPSAHYVELWGSWDNFSKPWEMKRDSRRGWGNWTGCHRFSDVIYDGDAAGFHEKRDGGLKMGGTYWYYYRVDGDEEYYDPSQPSSSSCPLLPGQYINVLEVPFERRFVSRSRASSVSLVTEFHTLNPEDRYLEPRPAPRPLLPKLMTKLDPSQFRAWSAAPVDSPHSAVGHRQIKSANSVPTDPFTFGMERSRTPVSAKLPGVGARGRSIRLNQAPERFNGTGQSHSRSNSSGFDKKSTDTVMQATAHIYTKPNSKNSSAIDVTKTRGQPSVQPFGLFPETDPFGTLFFDGPFRARAITAPERKPVFQPIHRRAFSHESGLQGANLALQEICAEEIVVPPRFEIPDCITEIDENSPPRVVQRRSLIFETDSIIMEETSRPETAVQQIPQKPNIDKALPQLPSYLVPSPLFSQSFPRPDDQAKDLFLNLDFQQSRFSAWSEDLAGSDCEDSELETGDGLSSTFSSVVNSGHPSPLQYSDPFFMSLGSPRLDSGKTKYSLSLSPDASSDMRDSVITSNDEEDSRSKKEMTQMEKLLDEFEYLGAALL